MLEVAFEHGGGLGLAQLPQLPALRRLVVGGTRGLDREDAEAIAGMSSLRALQIGYMHYLAGVAHPIRGSRSGCSRA
ncbi:MAG: hypothetical protein SFX73_27810 [Kofleriaceae bacterium]|nr:hypothetical protein [Kofleriaceae bacterium]